MLTLLDVVEDNKDLSPSQLNSNAVLACIPMCCSIHMKTCMGQVSIALSMSLNVPKLAKKDEHIYNSVGSTPDDYPSPTKLNLTP